VADRLAHDAVERRIGPDPPELEVTKHPFRGHLARGDAISRVGPAVPEPRGEHPRRQAGGAHGNQHVRLGRDGGQGEERQRLAQTVDRNGQLRHFPAQTAHVPVSGLDVRRRRVVVVPRDDDATAGAGANQIGGEAGGRFDIHVFRPAGGAD
jgi:hypothetical protein